MNRRFLTLACLVTATTFAADAQKLPSIPAERRTDLEAEGTALRR